MSESDTATDGRSGTTSLTVSNVGGIQHTEFDLRPGVTVLTGRNATNRTSLLSALGGVLGGTAASLKSDAQEGHVSLELDGETYRREYTRTEAGVQVRGTPYTDREALVDTCVTIFETNPARRAVQRGEDLREVIMRPVDTEAIRARIADLRREKQDVESELERVARRRGNLPDLIQTRDRLTDEIDALESELESSRAEVASFEADLEAAADAAEVVEELNDRRQELNSLVDSIDVKRAERDALQEDLEDLEAELDDLPADVSDELATVEADLAAARTEKRDLDDTIASLTTIVDFHEELLEEGVDLPGIEVDDADVTADLAPEGQRDVVCWTCGSRVERDDVGDRLDDLRAVIDDQRDSRQSLERRIEERQRRKRELETLDTRKTTVERRIAETREKIAARERTLEELTATREDLKAEIGRLEREIADADDLREADVLETYERISDLRYQRDQKERRRDDVIDEIEEIESLPTIDTLESTRDDLADDLQTERARISNLEVEAVEAFNEHMAELLDVLDYENVARVWIERKTPANGSGVDSESTAEFELHVVRETTDGTVYEDRVDHLSESEREVVGLVVALAGYLVHDVAEDVPFMLLDSLEAIDSRRIARLVDYFATHVPYLVVALLTEDADALDSAYRRVSPETLAA